MNNLPMPKYIHMVLIQEAYLLVVVQAIQETTKRLDITSIDSFVKFI